jgi:hypothetical protein
VAKHGVARVENDPQTQDRASITAPAVASKRERGYRVVRRIAALSLIVQLSSERARHALRQDCSFAKQQDSPPALPVVV